LTSVAGVILAAGRSVRMGKTKALLTMEGQTGETFVERAVRVLRAGGVRDVLAVANPETEAAIRAAVPAGTRIAVNPRPEDGMVSSILVALAALALPEAPERIIVTLVDIPEIRADVIRALGEAEAGADAWLIFPTFEDGRGHPLAILRAGYPELRRPLAMGLKTICAEHPEHVVDVRVAGRQPWDVDTPKDYERYRG
jgi:CTP:molybdopterin cytidylyltransferase MocA